MNCTLKKNGSLVDDDKKPLSLSESWEFYIKLEKGVTWDSVMNCILKHEEDINLLTASITRGYAASMLAEEWLELKDQVTREERIEQVTKLNIGFVADIFDGTKPYTLEIVSLFTGVIDNGENLEEVQLSTRSPAKLSGIPMTIDKSVKFYDPKNFSVMKVYKMDMKVREFFCGILGELCFYGDPFEREIVKIHFEKLIRNINVNAHARAGGH
jgi:hypothetical protein